MAKWTVRSLDQQARNGTTDHTFTFTQPAAGSPLLAVGYGAVTFTTPSGWTLVQSAILDGGLYLWSKTAAGTETSFTTTHNAANYPAVLLVYEFPSGSSILTSAAKTASGYPSFSGAALSTLTGTNLLLAVGGTANSSAGTPSWASWSNSLIEDTDAGTPVSGGTDGYGLGVAYLEDSALTALTPTATISNSVSSAESITIAVTVGSAAPAVGRKTRRFWPGHGPDETRRRRARRPVYSADTGGTSATGSTAAQQHTQTATTAAKQGIAVTDVLTQRPTTATTGTRATTGTGSASGRAAVTATGRKGAAAPTSEQQRATATVTSLKTGTGTGVAVQRSAASSTGTSAATITGTAATVQRLATSSAGRKTATSTSPDQQRSTTIAAGTKGTAGTVTSQQQRAATSSAVQKSAVGVVGLDQQHSTLRAAGAKATTGAGLDVQRAAITSAGAAVTGINGPGRTTQRNSVVATGRKTATVAALAQVRVLTTGTGTHRATGTAAATVRIHDKADGLRATSGAARVVQRSILAATAGAIIGPNDGVPVKNPGLVLTSPIPGMTLTVPTTGLALTSPVSRLELT